MKSSIQKCHFCGRLYESISDFDNGAFACPRCIRAAKNNDFPGADIPEPTKKKFVESDGFFDEKEYLQEDKGNDFFEADAFYFPK